jgi:hypothetical protein
MIDRSPSEPPLIVLDESYVFGGHRPEDAAAHRRFAVDLDAARSFGWTVEQARSQPTRTIAR